MEVDDKELAECFGLELWATTCGHLLPGSRDRSPTGRKSRFGLLACPRVEADAYHLPDARRTAEQLVAH